MLGRPFGTGSTVSLSRNPNSNGRGRVSDISGKIKHRGVHIERAGHWCFVHSHPGREVGTVVGVIGRSKPLRTAGKPLKTAC